MLRLSSACLIVALLLAAPAFAREPILVQSFDATALLHTPPANDSAQTKKELAKLHDIQSARTQAQFDKAAADGKDETVFLFTEVFGPNFTAQKLPKTTAFFAKVGNDESVYVGAAKKLWKRPRPVGIDPTMRPCGPGKSFAYPSGHASRAYVMAVALASIVPDKHDAIFERAADYAKSRLICGVHFPSDVEAGKLTGTALGAVMLATPAVRQALVPVRAELKAAGFTAR